ncbi:hypothetical protein HPB49_008011 [Dermacentor silvarum]|uniref:Uncharacterized protein n=1 Tax=Dermacentor silvarum TaxID=543639 RepID=A0ACB8DXL5_DERSI|nr:hypothetical protein HPB49_008011 [Dermacentor silvarum]
MRCVRLGDPLLSATWGDSFFQQPFRDDHSNVYASPNHASFGFSQLFETRSEQVPTSPSDVLFTLAGLPLSRAPFSDEYAAARARSLAFLCPERRSVSPKPLAGLCLFRAQLGGNLEREPPRSADKVTALSDYRLPHAQLSDIFDVREPPPSAVDPFAGRVKPHGHVGAASQLSSGQACILENRRRLALLRPRRLARSKRRCTCTAAVQLLQVLMEAARSQPSALKGDLQSPQPGLPSSLRVYLFREYGGYSDHMIPGAHRVRPNLRRNVVAVDTLPGEDLTALLAVRVICDVRVRAKALILNTCTGTLFDVDPTFDGATIFEGLESSVPVVAIARSGDVVTLRFAGDVVPEEVLLFRRRRAVRPRLPRPLQCGRCGLFGHATVTCSRDPRCLQCAGGHPTNSCTVDRRRCLHCGGPHAATEPRCPQWQLERRVAATLASSKPRITRKQALELARSSGTAVIDSSKQRPAGQRATESRPLSSRRQPGLSYSAALTGGTQADSSISGRVGEPPVTDNNPVQPPGATAPDTSVLVLTALASALRSLLELAPADSPARHIMASTPREQRPRIVQWNVRSMRCCHPELAGGALIDGCDVLALQETYVRAGELNLPGFVAYHSATSCQQASCTASPCVDPSHPAGRSRASLYVRAGLAQAEVNVCDLPCANVECVAVTVRVGATDTCVASVYVRSGRRWDTEFVCRLSDRVGGDLVVCGDFNSHHTAWGSNHIDCSGRGLLDSVLRAGLLIANTGAVTFVRSGCAGSAIDLTLVSDRCHYAWRRNPDTGGSDHFPIFLVPRATADLPMRSYSVVNWPRFRELCAAVPVSECGLFRHIAECARAATTRCVVPAGTPVPDIKQLNLRAARRRAQRKAVRTDKREHWTVYNRLDAVCRRHARQRRSASWSSLCCSLDDPRARSRPWRILGAVLRPRVPRCPALSIAVARGITNAQLAELLAATFCPPTAASTRPTGILQPHHHPRRELMAPQRYFPAAGTLEEISALCTADFTIGELRTVLASRRRRSAPGSDGVTYQMLRNFDSEQLHHLLDAYNAVWRSGVIPREWSEAVVVPLLKNGKPPRDPASYRPVSLTSAAGKVLEAMALRRLEWIAAVLDILAAEQSGFRRLRASADSLADVVTTLEEAKHRGDASYLVLLDVMSAFDQLPHATILDALCAMGVSGRLLAYVGAFLSGRTMRVRVGGALSQPRASALDAVDEYVRGIGLTLSAAKTEAMLVHPRYGAHRSAPQLRF